MNVLWGILICVVGVFLFVSGLLKSDFIVYRILIARSKILWKENVHTFYTVVGVIVFIFGILVALKVI